MQGLREYLLSVTAAAFLCAIAKHIVGEKGSAGKLIPVITGLFLCITVISPVIHIRLGDIEEYFDDFNLEAGAYSSDGHEIAHEEMKKIIKEQTEAYILDEAERLGTQITVDIQLSDDDSLIPCAVQIQGSTSPYQKQRMSKYISDYLGIPQENQIWN